MHASTANVEPVAASCGVAGHALVGSLALLALPASWDYVHFMAREGTPVLGLPFMWVFLPLVLLLVSWAARSVWGMAQAVREWRELSVGSHATWRGHP